MYVNREKVHTFIYGTVLKKDIIKVPEANIYKRMYEYENFTFDEDYTPENKEELINIFYNILNNGWTEFTFYCPTEYTSCIDDIREISSDKQILSNVNGYVSPFNAFSMINTTVSNYREVYVKVEKKYNDDEIKQVNAALDEIISTLKLNEMNTETKIKTFHDYLIKTVVYDESFVENKSSIHFSNKAVGALINNFAVCAGYSDTLALYLDRLNIPNIIIASDTHAWNLVYIDDYWLHIDATWNDTENKLHDYEFYLIDTNKLLEIDKKQHTFNKDFFTEAY